MGVSITREPRIRALLARRYPIAPVPARDGWRSFPRPVARDGAGFVA
ncbi:MAG TPA: hypothetical protein VFY93_03065 [Planctomycetota bacterium]|nr:hypothetical protein [Planctomycetota bacterium]